MALTIKKSNWDPKSDLKDASPLQRSCWAKFKIYNPKEKNTGWQVPIEFLDKQFYVILSEPIELQIETEWTETGGAEIAKKVNQIFNPKAIRALAGNRANAHAPNDEWSQKTTDIGKPLSAKLKFRIYDKNYDEPNNKNQTYDEMIEFLILVCAPRIRYSLSTNVLGPFIDAANKSKEFFEKLKKDKNSVKDDNTEEVDVLRSISNCVTNLSNDIKNQLLSKTRYNYTIYLESNNLTCNTSYSAEEPVIDEPTKSSTETTSNPASRDIAAQQGVLPDTAKTAPSESTRVANSTGANSTTNTKVKELYKHDAGEELHPDWYIKSFTWTPSTEMIIKRDEETDNVWPAPQWVDFEVDLETCIVWPTELIVANLH